MRIVDFHNHYYPPAYIEELKKGNSRIEVTTDREGNPVLHSPGDYNIVVPGHRDIEFRERVLLEHGIDLQVLTFTAPGTMMETPARSVELSGLVNDLLAEIVAARSGRFTALATLPLNDPAASARELERVLSDLNFPGVMLFSNANGVSLSDRRFWPLYEYAAEKQAVLYIHPTYPVGVEALQEYMLMPLVGFPFDTTLAAAKLIFSGVVERFPGIDWVLGHLGGAIPYLAERLDRGFEAFPACQAGLNCRPSELLRNFYYDTVNFDTRALQLALDFAGADHLVAGSDYPHQIGSLTKMVDSIEALPVSGEDREKILGGNAARILSPDHA